MIVNQKQKQQHQQQEQSMSFDALSFYPIEINGNKYLICKLPDQHFSTLHDPATKRIVGQWNNHAAQYEILPTDADMMSARDFDKQMKQLIASGAAFRFV